ncbi:MAG: hypothetical protein H3C58_01125 [Fimbriimonadaceae bacterium]|nr:hypothetical protein [Fimbriimonadaceae bacterium]
MTLEHLSPEQAREVLARAEEIQRRMDAGEVHTVGTDALLAAAEEAGLSREAIEQALAEVAPQPTQQVAPGQLVFALSADKKYYPAEVLATGPREVRVRFMSGGEHALVPEQVRPARFLPGEKITCPLPFWGWWACKVVKFDHKEMQVTVTDDWNTFTFDVSKVRLDPPKDQEETTRTKLIRNAYLWGVASGGIITAIVMRFLMR